MRKTLLAMTLMLLAAGCVSVTSDAAICDATATYRSDLSEALLQDGGDTSVVAGAKLISRLDAACGR